MRLSIKKNGSREFQGILPAVVSPHDGADHLDLNGFARHIEFLYEQGVHGIYVCGGTGEGYNMRLDERKKVLEVASEISHSRGVLIDHVGAQCTRDALELTEHAARSGATAISSMPPQGRNHQELVSYYSALSRVSDLPIFIYYMPTASGRNMAYEELLDLLDIEGVAGMKFSDANLFLMRRLLDARPQTVIFSGFDELLCPALQYGACGGIGTWYNVIPKAFLAIFDAAKRQDFNEAWSWQHRMIKLAEFGWTYGIKATVELLLSQQGRLTHAFRQPFIPFDLAFVESTASTLCGILSDLATPDCLSSDQLRPSPSGRSIGDA